MIDQSKALRRAARTGETDDISYASYVCGFEPPNFTLPAIPTRVGWMPSGINGFVGRPYWYVSTLELLWTFWKGLGLIEERWIDD